MPIDVTQVVDTLFIAMLENRSYDHMLGYLSLTSGANRPEIDGITSPAASRYRNVSAGRSYRPFSSPDQPLVGDLPHGRDLVQVQLDYSPVTGTYTMRGFVEAYRQQMAAATVKTKADPMAFMEGPTAVPMMDFFAREFAVCSRWFAPLPADTQPNRLMALSGFTTVDESRSRLVDQPTVYEWLTERGIRWRVYRSGLPFCTILGRMWDDMLDDDRFRSIRRLAADLQSGEPFPQVVFCEPAYGDSPVRFGFQPNDDHPPLPVAPGQDFLRGIYQALTQDAAREVWAKSVLVVLYDEHGGFFDHVPPMPIRTDPPAGVHYRPFESTGVRVPAMIVSPLVEPGSVHAGALDHTSVLQLIATRFGRSGETYSAAVDSRRAQGIGSLADVITRTEPRRDVPRTPGQFTPVVAVPADVPAAAKTANQLAFEHGAEKFLEERRAEAIARYPELAQWEAARAHENV